MNNPTPTERLSLEEWQDRIASKSCKDYKEYKYLGKIVLTSSEFELANLKLEYNALQAFHDQEVAALKGEIERLKKRSDKYPVGEQHPLSKLSKEAVLFIRESNLTQCKLASLFGVSQGKISQIVNNKAWKHLTV